MPGLEFLSDQEVCAPEAVENRLRTLNQPILTLVRGPVRARRGACGGKAEEKAQFV